MGRKLRIFGGLSGLSSGEGTVIVTIILVVLVIFGLAAVIAFWFSSDKRNWNRRRKQVRDRHKRNSASSVVIPMPNSGPGVREVVYISREGVMLLAKLPQNNPMPKQGTHLTNHGRPLPSESESAAKEAICASTLQD